MKYFTGLTAGALLMSMIGTTCGADPTTTGEVGDVADFLFRKATCKDFSDALSKTGEAGQTTREVLIVSLGVVYMEGYAAGAGNNSMRRADLIVRCMRHPEQPFNTVIPMK